MTACRRGTVCACLDEVRCRCERSAEPIRTCVGCRTRAAASGLLRVVAVAGALVPDPQRRHPGRGAWVHPDLGCLRLAERRRAFPRALRTTGELDTAEVRVFLTSAYSETAVGPQRTGDVPARDRLGRGQRREQVDSEMYPQS